MPKNREVKVASMNDIGRWMEFVETVQNEFHGIDLYHDERFKSGIVENIKRSTAIYIENDDCGEIIGAMMYSPTSHRIEWLAVGPNFRRNGIGAALMEYMFDKLPKDIVIEVKTFLETDPPGKTAQSFYESFGFKPKEILEDVKNRNAGNPFHLFVKE